MAVTGMSDTLVLFHGESCPECTKAVRSAFAYAGDKKIGARGVVAAAGVGLSGDEIILTWFL